MTFTGTEESRGGAGGRLPLTHFLFLLVQLVGCTPHLSCGGGFGTTTSQFLSFFIILFLFFLLFLFNAQQQSSTDSAESLRRAAVACNTHSCPPGVLMRACHCTVVLWSVQAWTCFVFIRLHFGHGVSRVSVHIFTLSMCVCDFPRLLHLFLTGKPQADWMDALLPSRPQITLLPALFLSLSASCSPPQRNKSSPLNGLTSPCSLCALFLLCWFVLRRSVALSFCFSLNFFNSFYDLVFQKQKALFIYLFYIFLEYYSKQ